MFVLSDYKKHLQVKATPPYWHKSISSLNHALFVVRFDFLEGSGNESKLSKCFGHFLVGLLRRVMVGLFLLDESDFLIYVKKTTHLIGERKTVGLIVSWSKFQSLANSNNRKQKIWRSTV